MKEYSTPIVEIAEINCEDIIQTSGLTNGGAGGAIDEGDSSIF